jgi:hypothetical protein
MIAQLVGEFQSFISDHDSSPVKFSHPLIFRTDFHIRSIYVYKSRVVSSFQVFDTFRLLRDGRLGIDFRQWEDVFLFSQLTDRL